MTHGKLGKGQPIGRDRTEAQTTITRAPRLAYCHRARFHVRRQVSSGGMSASSWASCAREALGHHERRPRTRFRPWGTRRWRARRADEASGAAGHEPRPWSLKWAESALPKQVKSKSGGSIQGPFRVLCRRMDPARARAGSTALVAAGALEPAGELEGFDEHGSGTTAQVLRGDVEVVRARRAGRKSGRGMLRMRSW